MCSGASVELEFLVILLVAVSVLGSALGIAWWNAERDFRQARVRGRQ
jgi:hypothetical protein